MLRKEEELDVLTVRISIDRRSGIVQSEFWNLEIVGANGCREQVAHRVGGPARLIRDPDTGVVICEEWIQKGKHHREGAPAFVERSFKTGIITYEDWALNGVDHRDDGPSLIRRDENTGRIYEREWWCHGKQSRRSSSRPKPRQAPGKGPSSQPR